jgi:cell division protease FtsH
MKWFLGLALVVFSSGVMHTVDTFLFNPLMHTSRRLVILESQHEENDRSTTPTDVYLKKLEMSSKYKKKQTRQSRYSRNWGENRRKRVVLSPPVVHVPVILYQEKEKVKTQTDVRRPRPTSESGAFQLEYNITTNFSHIGGYSDVKEELLQAVDFMQRPDKYEKYNVRLPRGILLYGPPGTGKTLFARCLAGEADVSFVATSGSSFHQRYVGVGSERLRELFTFAKQHNPCIIFIDEFDAIGRQRSSDGEPAQAERDTTLNQLLVELDGFKQTERVLLVAATNRLDILDEAVCRSGRIDKKIQIGLPDSYTREEIIKIHKEGKPIDSNVTLDDLVDLTAGLSGADIESILNEVVLQAIRKNTLPVNQTQLEDIHEQLLVGRSSTRLTMTETMEKRVSIHEIGHTVVSLYMEHHGPMKKVTISSPSGTTPGYTMFESEYNDLPTKELMEEKICVLLGGRAAEETVYGRDHVSTGAHQDMEMCRTLAESMLGYGFGSKILYPRFSENSKDSMDRDIDYIVTTMYKRAKRIIQKNIDAVMALSELLIERRTLKYSDIVEFFSENTDGVAS